MGRQCLKRLYLYCYHPEFKTEPDEATLAVFARGDSVGDLAQKAFPQGVLVEEQYWDHERAISHTLQLMEDKNTPAIFEGAFTHEDIDIRADVIERLPQNEWRLIEVKSSRRIYDTHLWDIAIQRYVMVAAGVDVSEACLMLPKGNDLSPDGGEVTVDKFFRIEDVTERIRPIEKQIPILLSKQRHALAQTRPPAISPGSHCTIPYRCDFYEYCRP